MVWQLVDPKRHHPTDSEPGLIYDRLGHLGCRYSVLTRRSTSTMPADLSTHARKSRKSTGNDDIVDIRRARGEVSLTLSLYLTNDSPSSWGMQISCAECRRRVSFVTFQIQGIYWQLYRLKLKCDRKIPCGTCGKSYIPWTQRSYIKFRYLARRGCPSICPNGNVWSAQGARSPHCCERVLRLVTSLS